MPIESSITTVTTRGRVSIPADLRKELDLARGQCLLWEKVNAREIRIVVLDNPPVPGAQAMRGFVRRLTPTQTTSEWMVELRDGEREG
jgi:AbrB family looped-hinge helix DNA binding protein